MSKQNPLCTAPRMQTAAGREPWSISGTINGKQVDNMLLDTGAAITVVSEDVISKEAKNGNTVPLRGLRPGITMFELADVQLLRGNPVLQARRNDRLGGSSGTQCMVT